MNAALNSGDSNKGTPKIFISYSWSSPEHEQWVLELAQKLESDGIEVVLDKWDLHEGHDKYAFMERTVKDPSISKVLLICDEEFARKADERSGGVGTETQIVSPEIYSSVSQDKFIPIVSQIDAAGKPFLPAFLSSRIYIDMSSDESYGTGYVTLVRRIFGRPVFTRPKRGQPPSYIATPEASILPTTHRLKLFKAAIEKGLTSASGLLDDYFAIAIDTIRETALDQADLTNVGERSVAAIGTLMPLRDEVVELLQFLARYTSDLVMFEKAHAFFENIIGLLARPTDAPDRGELKDNFRFIGWELFLYTTAILIKARRFDALSLLLDRGYFVSRDRFAYAGALRAFTALDAYMPSIDVDYKRAKQLNWITTVGHLLHERANLRTVTFDDLLQADFVLGLRSLLWPSADSAQFDWFPRLLIYGENLQGPFEIFVRSESTAFFQEVGTILKVTDKKQFLERVDSAIAENRLPRGDRIWMSPDRLRWLVAAERLSTRP